MVPSIRIARGRARDRCRAPAPSAIRLPVLAARRIVASRSCPLPLLIAPVHQRRLMRILRRLRRLIATDRLRPARTNHRAVLLVEVEVVVPRSTRVARTRTRRLHHRAATTAATLLRSRARLNRVPDSDGSCEMMIQTPNPNPEKTTYQSTPASSSSLESPQCTAMVAVCMRRGRV